MFTERGRVGPAPGTIGGWLLSLTSSAETVLRAGVEMFTVGTGRFSFLDSLLTGRGTEAGRALILSRVAELDNSRRLTFSKS